MYDIRQISVLYSTLAGQVKKELDEQFEAQKIKGTEYADVFNKLMDRVLTLAFEAPLKDAQVNQVLKETELTEKRVADQDYLTTQIRPVERLKLTCEVALCEANKKLTEAKTADQEYITATMRPVEKENALKDLDVKDANIAKMNKELEYRDKEMEAIDQDIVLKMEQVNLAKKDADLKTQQIALAQEDIALKHKQGELADAELSLKAEDIELRKAEVNIKIKQLEILDSDKALKDAQLRYTNRQIEGFDDNKAMKLFEAQMNAWAMMFSSGILKEKPSIITSDAVSSLYGCINPCGGFMKEECNEDSGSQKK